MEYVVVLVICGAITSIIAINKGKDNLQWFLIGCLLGPFGIILALVVGGDTSAVEKKQVASGEMKKCPYCAELIRAEAIKCRFCQSEVPSVLAESEDEPVAAPPLQDSVSSRETCPHCGAKVLPEYNHCRSCKRPYPESPRDQAGP